MGNNPISLIDPTGGFTEDPPTWEGEDGELYFDFLSGQEYQFIDGQGWTEVVVIDGNSLNLGNDGFANAFNITNDRIKALEYGRGSMDRIVKSIILHRTVGNNYPGAYMKRQKKIKGAHFFIDKDGTTYQTASLNKSVGHLYNSKSQMLPGYYGVLTNSNTIGIEVVGYGEYFSKRSDIKNTEGKLVYYHPTLPSAGVWDPLTPAQVKAVTILVKQLQNQYNIHSKYVYPHEKVQKKTPGEGQAVYDAIFN